MATWSAFGFGGFEPVATFFERESNRNALQDAADINRYNSAWAASELPSLTVQGLKKAGLNPILAFDQGHLTSAGSVGGVSPLGSSSHSSVGNPLMIAREKSAIAQSNSAANAQQHLADLYDAQKNFYNEQAKNINVQTERNRYIPLTETDSGGFSILGSGFNASGTDTLLFDTRNGQVIRPKNQGGSNSADAERRNPVRETKRRAPDVFKFTNPYNWMGE